MQIGKKKKKDRSKLLTILFIVMTFALIHLIFKNDQLHTQNILLTELNDELLVTNDMLLSVPAECKSVEKTEPKTQHSNPLFPFKTPEEKAPKTKKKKIKRHNPNII